MLVPSKQQLSVPVYWNLITSAVHIHPFFSTNKKD